MGQTAWGVIAGVTAAALLVAEHYWPWERLLGRKLPPPWTYVLGLLALLAPYSVWALAGGHTTALLVLWIVVCAGGLAVLGCYVLDALLDKRDQEDSRKRLRDAVRGRPQDRVD